MCKKKQGKLISVILTAIICLGLWTGFSLCDKNQSFAASSSAIEDNIVYIEIAEELFKLSDLSYTGKFFRLKNDIDLSEDSS